MRRNLRCVKSKTYIRRKKQWILAAIWNNTAINVMKGGKIYGGINYNIQFKHTYIHGCLYYKMVSQPIIYVEKYDKNHWR